MPEICLPQRVRCGTDMPGYGLNKGLCADIAYGLENVSIYHKDECFIIYSDFKMFPLLHTCHQLLFYLRRLIFLHFLFPVLGVHIPVIPPSAHHHHLCSLCHMVYIRIRVSVVHCAKDPTLSPFDFVWSSHERESFISAST